MTEVFDFAAERGACPFDPPPEYSRRSRERPLERIRLWDGSEVWLVMRHADVRKVLGDDTHFSADNRKPGFPLITPSSEALTVDNPTFIRVDPPEHGRQRSMVADDFTMRRAAAMRPEIQRVVDELVDEMVAKGPPADLVSDFALPLPTRVICTIMGVAYEDRAHFQRFTEIMTDVHASEAEIDEASRALTAFLADLVAAKAEAPGDDLLSRLVVERERAGELTRDDVVAMARLLLDAGHETTAMMIPYGMLVLMRHPDQFAAVRDDPALVPAAVEEMLRYLTVIHTGVPRVAVADVEIGGRRIAAGDGVLCYLPTANRDPDRFDNPSEFDIHRRARGHVAFGFGIHQCIGQPLARVELQIAFATLLRRLPELRLAVPFEDLRFRHDMFVEGVYEMGVTWLSGHGAVNGRRLRTAAAGESEYAAATEVFNLAAPARPVTAAVARSVEQIRQALREAEAAGLPVRVHTTGHGAAAVPGYERSLLIRTALDDGIEIDAERRRARVPAGARWGDVIDAAAPHGLAAAHGSSPLVGVVGYLLRGGVSFYGRQVGLAANTVRAIELVTADGQLHRVDESHDPELLWALRGGGGGFGVVTAIEFDLFPAEAVITGATYWSAAHADRLLPEWLDWCRDAPRAVTTTLRLMNLPDHPMVPDALRGGPVLCVDGAVLEPGTTPDAASRWADELLEPLHAVAAPLYGGWSRTGPAAVAQTHMDPTEPFPVHGDHMLLGDLGHDGATELLRVAGADSGSPLTNVELRQLGGALAAPDAPGGALDRFDARFAYLGGGVPLGSLTPSAITERCAVVRSALAPWDTGRTAPTFVEHVSQPQGHLTERQRLAVDRVRERVDPGGLFRGDIAPGTSSAAGGAPAPNERTR